jgi:Ca-activated chloride channel homolog
MNVELQLDHAAPERGRPLTLRALLRITGEAPQGVEHTPMNLALVLDRSGSMAGSKLAWTREAAALLVRRVWPEDRVSVVAYDDEVRTLAAGVQGDHHASVADAIGALHPGGCTNLSGGWLRGRDLVADHRVSAGVDRVVLMTDGLANRGITDRASLAALCRAAAEAGISTTTIGFGQDFDEDLLRAMADAGGGATYYVERPDQAPGIFEEEVEGLLSLAAQNVAVNVEVGAGAELLAVRHSYPSSGTEGGLRLEVGDLYAREPRLVLMDFLLADAEPGTEVELGRIRVEGHVLAAGGGVERRTIDLPVRFLVGDAPRVDAEVQRVSLMLEAARAREQALELQERGDWMGAERVLSDAATVLREAAPDDELVASEVQEFHSAVSSLQARDFGAADVKYMKQQAHDSRRSRMKARDKYRRET